MNTLTDSEKNLNLMNTRKTILIALLSVLSLQMFPLEGATYLLDKTGGANAIEKILLCTGEEEGSEEDPVKVKKIELVNDLNIFSHGLSSLMESLKRNQIKIGIPIDGQVELLIPPPNFI